MRKRKDIIRGFFEHRYLAKELGNEAVYEECNKILAGVAFAYAMMEAAAGTVADGGKSQLANMNPGFLYPKGWEELNAWLEEQRRLGL
ncbi:MAG: hypothetical protein FWD16_07135, partial [Clostridia bacterium]|nr:hypothetical protein [Clostridia bacterium]